MVFFRKNGLLILLAFLATILFVLRVFVGLGKKEPPQPIVFSWKGVVPGETQTAQLTNILGIPENSSQERSQITFSFRADDGGPPDRIISENNVVGIIKEHYFEGKNLTSFIEEYGQPEAEFWGEYKTVGFKTYVFPGKGIALVANQNDGGVIQIWYFKPTTISEFLLKWGQGLSTEFKEIF